MNRLAKDGARSSFHYGGEGVLIHPSNQGVCGWHGTEDLDIIPGGLFACPGMPYVSHVFVCTNDRGGDGKSCADNNSQLTKAK
jgi:hypothetical protein